MPASTLPERGRARDLGELEALHPAAHRVGRAGEEDRRAEDRAELVGAAGDREHRDAEPERGREAEAGDRRAPDDDRAPRPRRPGGARGRSSRRSARRAARPPTAPRRARRRRRAPASKWCAAIAGKSACGIPKTIAFVSSTNVPRITGCSTRNRQPSRSDSSASAGDLALGRRRRDQQTAASEAAKVARVDHVRRSRRRPPRSARRRAPGPTIAADVAVDRLQRLRRGELLRRDEARHHRAQGRRAERPAARSPTNASTYSAQTCGLPANALTASSSRRPPQPDVGARARPCRRSSRSAIVPPNAAKSSSGTASQIESSPTWSAEPVSW